MMEHYQFSARNTEFLSVAAHIAKQSNLPSIAKELQRNFDEERGHAKIYKKSLAEIGTDVEKRTPFFPTALFFNEISSLISNCAHQTLG